MTKFTFIKSLFLAIALLAGSAVWGQGTESFNHASTSSSYSTINWTGNNGLTWNAADARGDQSITSGNKAICIRQSATGKLTGPLTTTQQAAGIGRITFTAKNTAAASDNTKSTTYQFKCGSVTKTITIAAMGTNSSIVESPDINSTDATQIEITMTASSGVRVTIDDLSWTAAAAQTAVATPTISATGNQKATDDYYNSATITLSTTTEGATIHYTTNGDAPTSASTAYTAPFEITAASTIKAIAIKDGLDNSTVAEKTINISVLNTPTITVTEVAVPAMTAVTGLTDSETVNVSGIALTANIIVSIDGADAAMFEVLPATISQTNGEASGIVTVTYKPTTPGTHTATLKFNSTDATEVTRTLNGTSAMATPVAIDASGISTSGFTANWNAVAGATEYELSVYTKGGSTPLNLVSNPGFESGLTTSWNFESSMNQQVATDIVKSGTYSLKSAVTATKKITQTIAVESGKEYTLSFWYYLDNASTGSGFRVWTTTGATINLPSNSTYFNTKGSWEQVQHTFTASANSLILELRLYNGATLYLDDFSITGDETTTIPITGSPFTVTNETSKTISELSDNTQYFYKVVAKNGSVATASSNEISVTTSTGTGLNNAIQNLQLRAVNGSIVLNSEAGKLVEVYNSIGQKVASHLTSEGINTIPARVKGVVFVKIGSEISKLIME